MTVLLMLLVLGVVVDLVATLRVVHSDRPTAPPPSHRDWANGYLPSSPFSARS